MSSFANGTTSMTADINEDQPHGVPPTKRSRAVLADDTDNVPFVYAEEEGEEEDSDKCIDKPVTASNYTPRTHPMALRASTFATTVRSHQQKHPPLPFQSTSTYTQNALAHAALQSQQDKAEKMEKRNNVIGNMYEDVKEFTKKIMELTEKNQHLQSLNEEYINELDENDVISKQKDATIQQQNSALEHYETRDRRNARMLPWRVAYSFVLMLMWVIAIAHVNYVHDLRLEAHYKHTADAMGTMWGDLVTHWKAMYPMNETVGTLDEFVEF